LSLASTTFKKCCMSLPIWIFVYSDGSILTICESDFKSPAYRNGVSKIINIESQEVFTPEFLFGGSKIGKL